MNFICGWGNGILLSSHPPFCAFLPAFPFFLFVSNYRIFLPIFVCSSSIISVTKGKHYLGVWKYKMKNQTSEVFSSLTLKYFKTVKCLWKESSVVGELSWPWRSGWQLQILYLWVLLFEHISVKLQPFTTLFIDSSLIFSKHFKPRCFINAWRDFT